MNKTELTTTVHLAGLRVTLHQLITIMVESTPDAPIEDTQLGFCIDIEDNEHLMSVGHRSPDYREWDGGQVGGAISWLRPSPQRVVCCDNPMQFVCQLYAPREGLAFHRTLYVFACRACHAMRVLRCQLPADNDYYPNYEGNDVEEVGWTKHLSQTTVCAVCGMHATGKCPVQNLYFCGRLHQLQHRKQQVPPMYQLVVEQEPETVTNNEGSHKPTLFDDDDDENDSDADLEQSDLNQMTGRRVDNQQDETTRVFLQRIQRPRAQTQCLRYGDKEPLWMHEKNKLPDKPPPCVYCGGPRKFECQIMPQMLNYLQETEVEREDRTELLAALEQTEQLVNELVPEQVSPVLVDIRDKALERVQQSLYEGGLDWGVVAIYTCSANCNTQEYMEEYFWTQPSLDGIK